MIKILTKEPSDDGFFYGWKSTLYNEETIPRDGFFVAEAGLEHATSRL